MSIKVCNLYTIVRSHHIVELVRILKTKKDVIFGLFACFFKPFDADFFQNLALFDIIFLLILILTKPNGIEIIFVGQNTFDTSSVTCR